MPARSAPVIAVANLKGGVGKTTSAVYLAATAVREGYDVTVVDADPQGSALEWLGRAPEGGVDVVAAATPRRVESVLSGISRGLAVVDTPPGAGDEKIVESVLARSDALVIPTRVGGTEASRVRATLELVPRGLRHGVVICAARSGTRGLTEALEEWPAAGVEVWGVIPERVSIAEGAARPLSVLGLIYYRSALENALGSGKRPRRALP